MSLLYADSPSPSPSPLSSAPAPRADVCALATAGEHVLASTNLQGTKLQGTNNQGTSKDDDLLLPANWDDLDPLSLEPVNELTTWFEMTNETTGRVSRYDAWAWLEMLVRDASGAYVHPVTRHPIGVKARAACVQACVQACDAACGCACVHATEAHTATATGNHLVHENECSSRRLLVTGIRGCIAIKRSHARDPDTGRLVFTRFFAGNPSLDVRVTASWTTWDASEVPCPEWARNVHSEAAIQYVLEDACGLRVSGGTMWL